MASSIATPSSTSDLDGRGGALGRPARASVVLGYAVSLAMVAAAGIVAFAVDQMVQAPNLSLVFVLPVIVAAASFGWGPALFAALAGVAIFDFFFVEPRMSFQVANPTDLWALALLLSVAAIVSTVAAQSRRRALEARRAAEQAEALHALADAIIKTEPSDALIRTAAESLGRLFDAPAVVLAERAGELAPAAVAGAASLSAADLDAAKWALANDRPTRAETYPFDLAGFDFWPVQTPADRRLVLGVKLTGRTDGRPAVPDRQVELVAAYLAAASTGPRAGGQPA